MKVETALEGDIPGWLGLAGEVEPLFGPMIAEPGFLEGLKNAIKLGNAFCIRDEERPGNGLWGGILISPADNEVAWLAVSSQQRGKGVGIALLAHALDQFDQRAEIKGCTFDQTVKEGLPARRIYERFGFKDHHPAGLNPAGVPIVWMVKPAGVPENE